MTFYVEYLVLYCSNDKDLSFKKQGIDRSITFFIVSFFPSLVIFEGSKIEQFF